MRDLCEVLDAMLEVIPEDQDKLRRKLSSVRNSAGYTAPEIISERWRQALAVLVDEIGDDPREPWAIDATEIFAGRKYHA